MRWNVEGADSRTGSDRLITVEADDAHVAESIARSRGMLIAAVHPVKVISASEKLEQMMAGTLDASSLTTPATVDLAAEWNARVTERTAEIEREQAERHLDDDPNIAPARHTIIEPAALTASSLLAAAAPDCEVDINAGDTSTAGEPLEYHRRIVPKIGGAPYLGEAPEYRGLRIASVVLGVLAMLAYIAGVVQLVTTSIGIGTSSFWSNSNWSSNLTYISAQIFAALMPAICGAVLHGLSAACMALRDLAQNSFHR